LTDEVTVDIPAGRGSDPAGGRTRLLVFLVE
jgi:hypothetical protein